MCVCVYLVQVCLAACAESPLAWVSPSGPPRLLLESAEQHKPPCFYLFLVGFFPSVVRPVLPSGPVYLSDCGEAGQRSQTAAVSDDQGLGQQAGGRVLRRVRLVVHCSDKTVSDYGSLAGTRRF